MKYSSSPSKNNLGKERKKLGAIKEYKFNLKPKISMNLNSRNFGMVEI